MNFKWLKKAIIVAGAASLMMTSLTACGKKESQTVNGLDKDAVVYTVGDEQIKLSEAYFIVKWQEASYYNIFGYNYGDDWYKQDLVGVGKPFQDYIKDSCLEILKRICISRDKFEEYGLEFTAEEESEIEAAVDKFMDSNSAEARNAMMADEDVVRTVLTDYKMLEKVAAKAVENVDTVVSESELKEKAYTRTYDYIYISFATTDENGNETMVSAAEQEDYVNILNTIRAETISGTDFDTAAENAGQTVSSHTYTPGATASEDRLYEINDYMDDLEIGEISEVIPLDTTGVLLAYMKEDNTDNLDDKETLENAREALIAERKQDLFKSVMKDWQREVNIELDEDLWSKVTMEEPLSALSGNNK